MRSTRTFRMSARVGDRKASRLHPLGIRALAPGPANPARMDVQNVHAGQRLIGIANASGAVLWRLRRVFDRSVKPERARPVPPGIRDIHTSWQQMGVALAPLPYLGNCAGPSQSGRTRSTRVSNHPGR